MTGGEGKKDRGGKGRMTEGSKQMTNSRFVIARPQRLHQTDENDKPGEHPPTPFKGGTFGHSSPFEGGRGMFLYVCHCELAKQSNGKQPNLDCFVVPPRIDGTFIPLFNRCHDTLLLDKEAKNIVPVCKEYDADEQDHTGNLCVFEKFVAGFAACDDLVKQEQYVSAIQSGDGEYVHKC